MSIPRVPQRTTPGFAFSMVNRALQECLAVRQFGQTEIAQVLDFFGADPPECAFCGSPNVSRWDHLVPVNSSGETVLGNMVPSCARCDDSKRNLSFEEWMAGDARLSPKSRGVSDIDERIQRIQTYMQHFGYEVRAVEDRLTAQELERLRAIQAGLEGLRRDVDALILDYRTRTGHT